MIPGRSHWPVLRPRQLSAVQHGSAGTAFAQSLNGGQEPVAAVGSPRSPGQAFWFASHECLQGIKARTGSPMLLDGLFPEALWNRLRCHSRIVLQQRKAQSAEAMRSTHNQNVSGPCLTAMQCREPSRPRALMESSRCAPSEQSPPNRTPPWRWRASDMP